MAWNYRVLTVTEDGFPKGQMFLTAQEAEMEYVKASKRRDSVAVFMYAFEGAKWHMKQFSFLRA